MSVGSIACRKYRIRLSKTRQRAVEGKGGGLHNTCENIALQRKSELMYHLTLRNHCVVSFHLFAYVHNVICLEK